MGRWTDNWTDFTPAGALGNVYSSISGNENPIDGLWNTLRGNPQDIKAAYDQAMQTSQVQGDKIRDFLLGRQAQAQQFYAPMQSMFQNMYGSRGIQGPQTPGVPGSQPLGNPQMSTMFGMAQKMGPGGR